MKKYFCCEWCGRCYGLKGRDLTDECEKKMKDLQRSWLKQGEFSLCCREEYDNWYIKNANKKVKNRDKKS